MHSHSRDGHDHGHGHSHGHSANAKAVGIAALLTGGFMGIEVLGGLLSGSLALIADAGHMLTDFAALSLSWLAFRMTKRPADGKRTYGFDRLSVLAAFINGLGLFVVSGWIVYEAVQRLSDPHPITGGIMLTVGVMGLLVNILSFWILSRGDRDNLNMRAALLHVLGDLLGSVAAIVAAGVILATGWTPIDPILSVLVAVLILRSAWFVVRQSAHILLEGSPGDFDPDEISADLKSTVPALADVRHLHAWSISEERPMVTLEAVLRTGADHEETRQAIKSRLSEKFGFGHTTVELQPEGPQPELPHGCSAPI